MKYIITESRMHQVIFKYLDMQNLVKTDVKIDLEDFDFHSRSFYFRKNKGDQYEIMSYDYGDNILLIYGVFVDEVSNMFSLSNEEMSQAITSWVENVFDVKVSRTNVSYNKHRFLLT